MVLDAAHRLHNLVAEDFVGITQLLNGNLLTSVQLKAKLRSEEDSALVKIHVTHAKLEHFNGVFPVGAETNGNVELLTGHSTGNFEDGVRLAALANAVDIDSARPSNASVIADVEVPQKFFVIAGLHFVLGWGGEGERITGYRFPAVRILRNSWNFHFSFCWLFQWLCFLFLLFKWLLLLHLSFLFHLFDWLDFKMLFQQHLQPIVHEFINEGNQWMSLSNPAFAFAERTNTFLGYSVAHVAGVRFADHFFDWLLNFLRLGLDDFLNHWFGFIDLLIKWRNLDDWYFNLLGFMSLWLFNLMLDHGDFRHNERFFNLLQLFYRHHLEHSRFVLRFLAPRVL